MSVAQGSTSCATDVVVPSLSPCWRRLVAEDHLDTTIPLEAGRRLLGANRLLLAEPLDVDAVPVVDRITLFERHPDGRRAIARQRHVVLRSPRDISVPRKLDLGATCQDVLLVHPVDRALGIGRELRAPNLEVDGVGLPCHLPRDRTFERRQVGPPDVLRASSDRLDVASVEDLVQRNVLRQVRRVVVLGELREVVVRRLVEVGRPLHAEKMQVVREVVDLGAAEGDPVALGIRNLLALEHLIPILRSGARDCEDLGRDTRRLAKRLVRLLDLLAGLEGRLEDRDHRRGVRVVPLLHAHQDHWHLPVVLFGRGERDETATLQNHLAVGRGPERSTVGFLRHRVTRLVLAVPGDLERCLESGDVLGRGVVVVLRVNEVDAVGVVVLFGRIDGESVVADELETGVDVAIPLDADDHTATHVLRITPVVLRPGGRPHALVLAERLARRPHELESVLGPELQERLLERRQNCAARVAHERDEVNSVCGLRVRLEGVGEGREASAILLHIVLDHEAQVLHPVPIHDRLLRGTRTAVREQEA